MSTNEKDVPWYESAFNFVERGIDLVVDYEFATGDGYRDTQYVSSQRPVDQTKISDQRPAMMGLNPTYLMLGVAGAAALFLLVRK